MSQFWTGGHGAYQKGVEEEVRRELAELKSRLKTAGTEAERQPILDQIRQVKNRYKDQSRGTDECLF